MTQIQKREYILKSLEKHAVHKIQTGSNGLMIATIFYFFISYLAYDSLFNLVNIYLTIGLILTLFRLYVSKLYYKNNFDTKYYNTLNYLVILTSITWFLIITKVIYKSASSFPLIMMVCFSSGTMVTFAPTNLSHHKGVLLIFVLGIFSPILVFFATQFIKIDEPVLICMYFFAALFIFYFIQHSATIRSQLVQFYIDNYELQKSNKEIERKSKQLEEETLKTFHVTRLSSLGEMAGSIAHEINNPLMIITGAINLLEKNQSIQDNNDLSNKFNKIKKASLRIANIVKSMKMISSKHDNVPKEAVNLNQIIEQIITLYEEKFKIDEVKFKYNAIGNLIVKANPVQISQIIMNLISNAYDECQKTVERIIIIDLYSTGDQVCISVRNSGVPISKEIQDKIFEPFFTTKPLNKGTGLGLSISRNLAAENNGSLDLIESNDLIQFVLKLPKN